MLDKLDAAKKLADEYSRLAERANVLREELARIETHLIAGAAFCEQHGFTGARTIALNGATHVSEEARRAGYTMQPGVHLPPPTLAAIAVHAEAFAALQKGEPKK
ncbi:MAG: hypothetical protein M3Z96_12995 [Pseudomonadota bacterium]|nr:hypothetical protein [Pseudomonadota bacterium]